MSIDNKKIGINAEIIADSLNPCGCRLTTFILEYPRFCHAEFMTHRMFSKNAASSRAIPIEKMIQQVIDNPAMPVWWGKNQSGMQAKEELDNIVKKFRGADSPETDLEYAKVLWLESRDKAIEQVRGLAELGLHKQIANRILEPWFNIRIIVTATDFENFFALRVHEDAQPEIRELATLMLKEYNDSTPKKLKTGEWHIPFGDSIDEEKVHEIVYKDVEDDSYTHAPKSAFDEIRIKIAIARCARVSYFNHEGKDDYGSDVKLCDRLFGSIPRHLSPTEHVAQAMGNSDYIANFKGFKQYRYLFKDQNLTDPRVIKK